VRGFSRVVLAGISELAEIATICALDSGMQITAIVDRNAARTHFVGLPVLSSFDSVPDGEAVVLTALTGAAEIFDAAVARLGADRVMAPAFLGIGGGGNGTGGAP